MKLLHIFSQDSKIRYLIAQFSRLVSLSVLNACKEHVFVFCTNISMEM